MREISLTAMTPAGAETALRTSSVEKTGLGKIGIVAQDIGNG